MVEFPIVPQHGVDQEQQWLVGERTDRIEVHDLNSSYLCWIEIRETFFYKYIAFAPLCH